MDEDGGMVEIWPAKRRRLGNSPQRRLENERGMSPATASFQFHPAPLTVAPPWGMIEYSPAHNPFCFPQVPMTTVLRYRPPDQSFSAYPAEAHPPEDLMKRRAPISHETRELMFCGQSGGSSQMENKSSRISSCIRRNKPKKDRVELEREKNKLDGLQKWCSRSSLDTGQSSSSQSSTSWFQRLKRKISRKRSGTPSSTTSQDSCKEVQRHQSCDEVVKRHSTCKQAKESIASFGCDESVQVASAEKRDLGEGVRTARTQASESVDNLPYEDALRTTGKKTKRTVSVMDRAPQNINKKQSTTHGKRGSASTNRAKHAAKKIVQFAASDKAASQKVKEDIQEVCKGDLTSEFAEQIRDDSQNVLPPHTLATGIDKPDENYKETILETNSDESGNVAAGKQESTNEESKPSAKFDGSHQQTDVGAQKLEISAEANSPEKYTGVIRTLEYTGTEANSITYIDPSESKLTHCFKLPFDVPKGGFQQNLIIICPKDLSQAPTTDMTDRTKNEATENSVTEVALDYVPTRELNQESDGENQSGESPVAELRSDNQALVMEQQEKNETHQSTVTPTRASGLETPIFEDEMSNADVSGHGAAGERERTKEESKPSPKFEDSHQKSDIGAQTVEISEGNNSPEKHAGGLRTLEDTWTQAFSKNYIDPSEPEQVHSVKLPYDVHLGGFHHNVIVICPNDLSQASTTDLKTETKNKATENSDTEVTLDHVPTSELNQESDGKNQSDEHPVAELRSGVSVTVQKQEQETNQSTETPAEVSAFESDGTNQSGEPDAELRSDSQAIVVEQKQEENETNQSAETPARETALETSILEDGSSTTTGSGSGTAGERERINEESTPSPEFKGSLQKTNVGAKTVIEGNNSPDEPAGLLRNLEYTGTQANSMTYIESSEPELIHSFKLPYDVHGGGFHQNVIVICQKDLSKVPTSDLKNKTKQKATENSITEGALDYVPTRKLNQESDGKNQTGENPVAELRSDNQVLVMELKQEQNGHNQSTITPARESALHYASAHTPKEDRDDVSFTGNHVSQMSDLGSPTEQKLGAERTFAGNLRPEQAQESEQDENSTTPTLSQNSSSSVTRAREQVLQMVTTNPQNVFLVHSNKSTRNTEKGSPKKTPGKTAERVSEIAKSDSESRELCEVVLAVWKRDKPIVSHRYPPKNERSLRNHSREMRTNVVSQWKHNPHDQPRASKPRDQDSYYVEPPGQRGRDLKFVHQKLAHPSPKVHCSTQESGQSTAATQEQCFSHKNQHSTSAEHSKKIQNPTLKSQRFGSLYENCQEELERWNVPLEKISMAENSLSSQRHAPHAVHFAGANTSPRGVFLKQPDEQAATVSSRAARDDSNFPTRPVPTVPCTFNQQAEPTKPKQVLSWGKPGGNLQESATKVYTSLQFPPPEKPRQSDTNVLSHVQNERRVLLATVPLVPPPGLSNFTQKMKSTCHENCLPARPHEPPKTVSCVPELVGPLRMIDPLSSELTQTAQSNVSKNVSPPPPASDVDKKIHSQVRTQSTVERSTTCCHMPSRIPNFQSLKNDLPGIDWTPIHIESRLPLSFSKGKNFRSSLTKTEDGNGTPLRKPSRLPCEEGESTGSSVGKKAYTPCFAPRSTFQNNAPRGSKNSSLLSENSSSLECSSCSGTSRTSSENSSGQSDGYREPNVPVPRGFGYGNSNHHEHSNDVNRSFAPTDKALGISTSFEYIPNFDSPRSSQHYFHKPRFYNDHTSFCTGAAARGSMVYQSESPDLSPKRSRSAGDEFRPRHHRPAKSFSSKDSPSLSRTSSHVSSDLSPKEDETLRHRSSQNNYKACNVEPPRQRGGTKVSGPQSVPPPLQTALPSTAASSRGPISIAAPSWSSPPGWEHHTTSAIPVLRQQRSLGGLPISNAPSLCVNFSTTHPSAVPAAPNPIPQQVHVVIPGRVPVTSSPSENLQRPFGESAIKPLDLSSTPRLTNQRIICQNAVVAPKDPFTGPASTEPLPPDAPPSQPLPPEPPPFLQPSISISISSLENAPSVFPRAPGQQPVSLVFIPVPTVCTPYPYPSSCMQGEIIPEMTASPTTTEKTSAPVDEWMVQGGNFQEMIASPKATEETSAPVDGWMVQEGNFPEMIASPKTTEETSAPVDGWMVQEGNFPQMIASPKTTEETSAPVDKRIVQGGNVPEMIASPKITEAPSAPVDEWMVQEENFPEVIAPPMTTEEISAPVDGRTVQRENIPEVTALPRTNDETSTLADESLVQGEVEPGELTSPGTAEEISAPADQSSVERPERDVQQEVYGDSFRKQLMEEPDVPPLEEPSLSTDEIPVEEKYSPEEPKENQESKNIQENGEEEKAGMERAGIEEDKEKKPQETRKRKIKIAKRWTGKMTVQSSLKFLQLLALAFALAAAMDVMKDLYLANPNRKLLDYKNEQRRADMASPRFVVPHADSLAPQQSSSSRSAADPKRSAPSVETNITVKIPFDRFPPRHLLPGVLQGLDQNQTDAEDQSLSDLTLNRPLPPTKAQKTYSGMEDLVLKNAGSSDTTQYEEHSYTQRQSITEKIHKTRGVATEIMEKFISSDRSHLARPGNIPHEIITPGPTSINRPKTLQVTSPSSYGNSITLSEKQSHSESESPSELIDPLPILIQEPSKASAPTFATISSDISTKESTEGDTPESSYYEDQEYDEGSGNPDSLSTDKLKLKKKSRLYIPKTGEINKHFDKKSKGTVMHNISAAVGSVSKGPQKRQINPHFESGDIYSNLYKTFKHIINSSNPIEAKYQSQDIDEDVENFDEFPDRFVPSIEIEDSMAGEDYPEWERTEKHSAVFREDIATAKKMTGVWAPKSDADATYVIEKPPKERLFGEMRVTVKRTLEGQDPPKGATKSGGQKKPKHRKPKDPRTPATETDSPRKNTITSTEKSSAPSKRARRTRATNYVTSRTTLRYSRRTSLSTQSLTDTASKTTNVRRTPKATRRKPVAPRTLGTNVFRTSSTTPPSSTKRKKRKKIDATSWQPPTTSGPTVLPSKSSQVLHNTSPFTITTSSAAMSTIATDTTATQNTASKTTNVRRTPKATRRKLVAPRTLGTNVFRTSSTTPPSSTKRKKRKKIDAPSWQPPTTSGPTVLPSKSSQVLHNTSPFTITTSSAAMSTIATDTTATQNSFSKIKPRTVVTETSVATKKHSSAPRLDVHKVASADKSKNRIKILKVTPIPRSKARKSTPSAESKKVTTADTKITHVDSSHKKNRTHAQKKPSNRQSADTSPEDSEKVTAADSLITALTNSIPDGALGATPPTDPQDFYENFNDTKNIPFERLWADANFDVELLYLTIFMLSGYAALLLLHIFIAFTGGNNVCQCPFVLFGLIWFTLSGAYYISKDRTILGVALLCSALLFFIQVFFLIFLSATRVRP